MQALKLLGLRAGILFLKLCYLPMKALPVQYKAAFFSRQSNRPSVDMTLLAARLEERYPGIRTVVFAKKLESPLYAFHILRQMYHIATARVVFLDSYCIPVSVLSHRRGPRVVQLWHAMGSMKKFGYAMIGKGEGSSSEVAGLMKMHANYDAILISSRNYIKDYLEGFRADPSIIHEIPLPRADLLTDPAYRKAAREKLVRRIPALGEKRNILYCATFRKDGNTDDAHVRRLADAVDFTRYNLMYKPHPLSTVETRDPRIITEFADTFEALFAADYAITDYSSIMYEIGLLDIPAYIYAYDWETFREKREFNLDFQRDVPLLFTADPEKIVEAIEKGTFDRAAFSAFVGRNIVLPKEGTCTDAIIDLVADRLQK